MPTAVCHTQPPRTDSAVNPAKTPRPARPNPASPAAPSAPARRLWSRRHWLGTTAAASLALPNILPRGLRGANAPSNRITLGFIGVGQHGREYNMRSFLQHEDCLALAVCDVYANRRKAARAEVNDHYGTNGCREYADFRDLLAAGDIDAVVISTPDHWHTPMSIMAAEAGKDVMCEKPTLTIAEGRELVEVIQRHERVFQVGLEDRSVIQYHRLAELVRNGAIGELKRIYAKLPAGTAYPLEEEAPVPDDLDYELWTGPAPFSPYTPNRTERMHWRQIRDYSGGMLADWGAHLLDTAQVANFAEDSGPVEVRGEGRFPEDSMATTAVDYHLHYRYANGVEMEVESGGVELRFEGTRGWVGNTGWRGRLEGSSDEIVRLRFDDEDNRLWPLPANEHRDFLDCIQTREPTVYTAEAGHRLSTVMHIGTIAMELGRPLEWDPGNETFNDEQADALRSRASRDDWKNPAT